MIVIGLTGRARAGKDTVAEMIAEALPATLVFARQGFADKLKVSAALALGFGPATGDHDRADLIKAMDTLKVCGSVVTLVEHGPDDFQEVRISGREYLQRYGTEAHRDVFGEGFWLDAVLPLRFAVHDDASRHRILGRDDADVLVVPDVRFPNEAQRVLDVGGEVWEVLRPGGPRVEAHASEAGVPAGLITRSIVNAGSLDELRRMVAADIRSVIA